jgi:hypothetical protein
MELRIRRKKRGGVYNSPLLIGNDQEKSTAQWPKTSTLLIPLNFLSDKTVKEIL